MKIEYKIRDNFAEIIRCRGSVSKIVLPEQIAGYPVKKIAAYAFSAKKGVKSFPSLRGTLSSPI